MFRSDEPHKTSGAVAEQPRDGGRAAAATPGQSGGSTKELYPFGGGRASGWERRPVGARDGAVPAAAHCAPVSAAIVQDRPQPVGIGQGKSQEGLAGLRVALNDGGQRGRRATRRRRRLVVRACRLTSLADIKGSGAILFGSIIAQALNDGKQGAACEPFALCATS